MAVLSPFSMLCCAVHFRGGGWKGLQKISFGGAFLYTSLWSVLVVGWGTCSTGSGVLDVFTF